MVEVSVIINKASIIADQVLERLIEIFQTPIKFPEMIWIITPLIITMLLMEFYFGRYKDEELGWNTAFGNSLVLIFVAVDLIRYLYNNDYLFLIDTRNILVAIVIIEGILFTLLDFYHLIPKNIAYGVSSKSPINFVALIAVIVVYSNLKIDLITILALLLLVFVIYIGIAILYLLVFTPQEEKSKKEK